VTRLDGIRILVVDDDEDSRALLARMLAERGASVTTAPSADDALAKLEQETPDLLVSDIGMPHVDGYALIRRLRCDPCRPGNDTPAIALTAYARPEDGARALDAGFQAHLTKPIDADRLAMTVASLARKSTAREAPNASV
jgi:CheY-like chemotaxis protein